jgi:hypothetical protein
MDDGHAAGRSESVAPGGVAPSGEAELCCWEEPREPRERRRASRRAVRYAVVSADEAHGRTSPFRASAEAVGPAARARFRRALPGQKWGRWGPKAEEQLRESPVTTPRCMTDSRSRSCAADQHPLPRKLFPACSRRSPRTWPGQRVDASRHPRRTPSSPVPVDRGGCQEGARTMSTPSTTPSPRR